MGKANGLGDLVGDTGIGGWGDGEGVRASGDRGMCPADLRRLGECIFFATECNLFFSPWSDEGRGKCGWNPLAGLFGVVELGELDGVERGESDGLMWRTMGGEWPWLRVGEFMPESCDAGSERLSD